MRTFVAEGCNKTYAEGVYLHKFPKELKNWRLLSVSMLWSSVLFNVTIILRCQTSHYYLIKLFI